MEVLKNNKLFLVFFPVPSFSPCEDQNQKLSSPVTLRFSLFSFLKNEQFFLFLLHVFVSTKREEGVIEGEREKEK